MIITLSDKKKVLKNESQWPKTYTRKFLEQGLVDYSDVKLGTLLLRKETIDQMIPSFIDKPVIIKHMKVDENNFTDIAVGYIKNIYFNPGDGWYYVDFLITHDEGHEVLDNGWGVSCAYKVNQIISGGKYHNIDYNGEIVAGVGEHLALVENPRYEDCLMMVNDKEAFLYNEKTFLNRTTLKNNQEDTEMIKFNFFGKKDDKGFKPETLVDLGNGKKAKLGDIIAFNNSLEEKHEIEGNVEVELANGKKMKLEDAVAAFKAANEKTDKDEDSDEEKARKVEEGKKAENAMKLKNCGCGGKDGKHMDNCTMYNSDGSDKDPKDEKKDKEEKMENEIKALKIKNEALKAGTQHADTFVKINNARQKTEETSLLENGTLRSGTIEDKLESGKKFFTKKA